MGTTCGEMKSAACYRRLNRTLFSYVNSSERLRFLLLICRGLLFYLTAIRPHTWCSPIGIVLSQISLPNQFPSLPKYYVRISFSRGQLGEANLSREILPGKALGRLPRQLVSLGPRLPSLFRIFVIAFPPRSPSLERTGVNPIFKGSFPVIL